MKNFLRPFSIIFSVGLSSLLLFSSCDKKIAFYLQRFISEKKSPVNMLLVTADDSFFEEVGSTYIDSSILDEAALCARELGSSFVLSDFGYKNAVSEIDSLCEKDEPVQKREASLLGIKILFPAKKNLATDTRSPEISSKLLPFYNPTFSGQAFYAGSLSQFRENLPYSKHVFFRKSGKYLADYGFASLVSFLSVQKIQVTNGAIVLKKLGLPNGEKIDSLRLPRSDDGSILLKYPKKSWKNFDTIPFSEFYSLAKEEESLHKYLHLMDEHGLFGELNSESPLAVFDSALAAKNDFSLYVSQKRRFYMLMSAFLSGEEEKLLFDSLADESQKAFIKDSFADCRRIFSGLETKRAKLADAVRDSICYFALVADSAVDFSPSPFDSAFPETLSTFILANMIFSGDFISQIPDFASILLAFFFGIVFVIFAIRIKKEPWLLFFSLMMILLASSIMACSFVLFRLFLGFSIPLLTLLLLSLFFNFLCLRKTVNEKKLLKNSFLQCLPQSFLKKIYLSDSGILLDGQKNEASVMASSILNFKALSQLLKGNQLLAFLNYYFENQRQEINRFGGIVESYRNDEIVAIFGSPLPSEKHAELALRAAFGMKSCDISINEDIARYPRAPKPDGMSDDLYTAFFILNHNGKKISTRIGIYSSSVLAACLGSEEKKSFRIADDSWKKAIALRDAAKKYGSSGILLNGQCADYLRDECIIRRLGYFYDIHEETVYLSEILGDRQADDEKLWNYANYWNTAVDYMEKNEKSKALLMFKKLSEGRPNDKVARYFINLLGGVE